MSLEELLKQDATIVDVRTPVEFNTAHEWKYKYSTG